MFPRVKPITVRSVNQNDRQRLANLIHFESLVHRHLDWRAPLDWIGFHPYLIAEREDDLLAVLACPPDPPGVSWIRLFAISSGISAGKAWEELWPTAQAHLIEQTQAVKAAAIPLQRWFRNLLDKSVFAYTHNVLVLAWMGGELPPERGKSKASIRPMEQADLPAVLEIDEAAFGLMWQNSFMGIELAFRQSAVATVAEVSGELVGYQISTGTAMGGHLARLAVHPNKQRMGIGYELVRDLLVQFKRRGAHSVTVNTQHDNQVSLSLYQEAGFQPTGEEYPVYQHSLR